MSVENESLEAPNWLSELEKKREKRVKAKLGHETGAGALCIQCGDKCPGLDLHFWRKICKNCKCSKEDHDVHDDDIYGRTQFELLGSKPSRIKRKIVLPGKKDEVELEWAPRGSTETIDRYLKTLSPDALPVKGSQAAQTRKQLLHKQIPIHDLDPTLCHELTDSELAQMQEYIAHMKNSAGVGQVIQFAHNYGNLHILEDANAKFIANRYPKGVSSAEPVQLLGENRSGTLTKQFDKLGVKDQKELDAFFDKIPKPHNMATYSDNSGYLDQSSIIPQNNKQTHPYNFAEGQDLSNARPNYSESIHKVGTTDKQKLGYVNVDVQKSDYVSADGQNVSFADNQNFGSQVGQLSTGREINQNVGVGPMRFMREQMLGDFEGEQLDKINEINRNAVTLPHYPSGKLNIQSDQQIPIMVGKIRDMMLDTHDPTVDLANSNYRQQLPTYDPSQFGVAENELQPSKVKIGAIRDISYDNPEIKQAVYGENNIFDDFEVGRNLPLQTEETQSQQCRKCGKPFQANEFAIFVEKSNALYHSDCFRCAGCNQSLADMIYFYDKEMDDIYCGRDFAKIRGIPRCKACDELIFVKEYCLAENSTFHLKHFCCFECDVALAGQNYVLEDSQPVCLPCYEKLKAEKCFNCSKVIRPDEEGVSLPEGIHFHTADECFCCKICRKPLRGAKLMFKNRKLYCSPDCFRSDQS